MEFMRYSIADTTSPHPLALARRVGADKLQLTAGANLRAVLVERLFMPAAYGSCNAAHLLPLLLGPTAYHFLKREKTVLPDDLAHVTGAPEQRQAVSMLVSSGRAHDLIDMVRGGRLTLLLEGMQERGLQVPEPRGGWKGQWCRADGKALCIGEALCIALHEVAALPRAGAALCRRVAVGRPRRVIGPMREGRGRRGRAAGPPPHVKYI
jgi:hypothetical protein